MEYAVIAEKLNIKKQKKQIIKGVDLHIKAGRITGLIGPSGSGKTTLMRAIVGVQKYFGALTIFGETAGKKSLRPRIGYVTQMPAIYDDLTVHQNIAYFAAMTAAPSSRIARVLSDVSLADRSKQLVGSLSGGQRARVSLAIALLGEPDLLVLDEPTVGLDPILRNELWRRFRELADSGKTLLVSSHVMDEAERCDDIVLIRDGALLWNDSRANLLASTNTQNVSDAFVAKIEGVK